MHRWTLLPIANAVNHLLQTGIERHTDIETYSEYVSDRLEGVIQKSEPSYYVSHVIRDDVERQEKALFGDSKQIVGLWRTAQFVRNLSAAEDWDLMELLVDKNYDQAAKRIADIAEANESDIPFFALQQIKNPDWAASYATVAVDAY